MKSAKNRLSWYHKEAWTLAQLFWYFTDIDRHQSARFASSLFSLSISFTFTLSLDDMMIKTGANYLTIITHCRRKKFQRKSRSREGKRRTGKLSNLWKRIKMINSCECFYNEHEMMYSLVRDNVVRQFASTLRVRINSNASIAMMSCARKDFNGRLVLKVVLSIKASSFPSIISHAINSSSA